MTPSAFDIAGAVVAAPLAVLVLILAFREVRRPDGDDMVLCLMVMLLSLLALWSAFTVSRLLGASL